MSHTKPFRTSVTCLAGSLIALFVTPAPAPAAPPSLYIALGIRETDQAGNIGDFTTCQTGPIEVFADGYPQLTLDGTWQFFSFDLGDGPTFPFPYSGDGEISADRGTLEHIHIVSNGFGGPFTVWIDEVSDVYDPAGPDPNVALLISSFDDDGTGNPFPDGAEVMFQEPHYSGTTDQYIAPGDTRGIDNSVGHDDTHSVRIHWAFLEDDYTSWLRLTTWNALAQPCPLIAEPNGPAGVYEVSVISFWIKGIVDCNNNGIPDDQDIAGGGSDDCNANGVPDECEAIIVYVDDDATGLNDGSGWADAYVDLQDALDETHANCLVSEIWVAAGTYKPDGASPGDRLLSFELVDGVALYGGFAGDETDLSQRPLDPDPFTIDPAVDSVLSGEIGDSGTIYDNSNHVVYCDNSSAGILDGFTVTGGYAPDDGGGMFIDWAYGMTVTNCTFMANYSEYTGGGMVIVGDDTTVTNCTFRGNIAGLSLDPYVDGYGGGMNIGGLGTTVTNCTFWGNEAGLFTEHAYGGGMSSWGNTKVANCKFFGNSAGSMPGIYGYGGAMYIVSSTEVNCCTLSANYAGDVGGGIYIEGGAPTVANCILWSDNALNTADEIWDSSGMLVVSYSNVDGGWPGEGEGNIDLDPMFADAPYGDLRLLAGSPCIDAGNNLALPADVADLDSDGDTDEPIPLDLAGNPRFMDDPNSPDCWQAPLTCGPPPIADMGAYEFSGDCQPNGVPDLQDITDGTSEDCNHNWVPDECEPDEDCNGNGTLDICDIGNGTSEDCNFNWVPDECEPDFDGDGLIDDCDDDIDDDGVLNDDDVCDYTPPGAPIVTDPQDPLYGTLRHDSDGDCDVDLDDWTLMQQEFTGPN